MMLLPAGTGICALHSQKAFSAVDGPTQCDTPITTAPSSARINVNGVIIASSQTTFLPTEPGTSSLQQSAIDIYGGAGNELVLDRKHDRLCNLVRCASTRD